MLNVENIECLYGDQTVLNGLSFHVAEGEICCLLGPSGCGKTTALRAIAGFQSVTKGQINLGDQLLSKPGFQVEPEQRHIGMVFQDYALFPHMTVRDNICFGIRKSSPQQQKETVEKLLSLIKLKEIAKRYPHELSGGQQQRVALARALAPNPKLLLLDEPFSNLDIELRKHLNLEVRDILKQYGTSAILVTHDQDEAFAFADHIGLMFEGELQQWDSAFNLFHEPSNRFVANFIGQGSLLPGTSIDTNSVKTELGIIVGNRSYPWPSETPVDILIRPDDIVLSNEQDGLAATVTRKVFSGSATLYALKLSTGSIVEALFTSHHDFALGDSIHVKADVEHLIAFSPE